MEKGDLLDEFQFLCEKFNQMRRSAAEKNLVIENLKKTIEDQSLNKGFVNSKTDLLFNLCFQKLFVSNSVPALFFSILSGLYLL